MTLPASRDLDVDEAGFRAAMDEHSIASGGGKAMGKMGGEDAEFYAGIVKDLQNAGKLGKSGVEYDPYEWLQVGRPCCWRWLQWAGPHRSRSRRPGRSPAAEDRLLR